jgi:hypothetical protein
MTLTEIYRYNRPASLPEPIIFLHFQQFSAVSSGVLIIFAIIFQVNQLPLTFFATAFVKLSSVGQKQNNLTFYEDDL